MKFKSFFRQQLLEEIDSQFNGPIQVVEFFKQRKIIAGGLIQSGGILTNIWNKGLKKIKSKKLKIQNVLILGLGGGTAARLIVEKWPKVKITGIEIDPVMIKLGRKYFGLDKISQLKIIQAEASEWLLKCQLKKFDLILVDLYQGEKICSKIEEKFFLDNLRKKLADKGIVIFNCLFYAQHQQAAKNFIKKLEEFFNKIELVRIWSNLLILGQKKI